MVSEMTLEEKDQGEREELTVSEDAGRVSEIMTEQCCLAIKKVIGDDWERDLNVVGRAQHQKEWLSMQKGVEDCGLLN